MAWMTKLKSSVDFKILPEGSQSIIGSSSKNTAGELYTVDVNFNISNQTNRRNKRLFDVLLSIKLLIFSPLLIFFIFNKIKFLNNIFAVLTGKKTWVGYKNSAVANLPKIRNCVLSPLDAVHLLEVNQPTIERLNYFYAKDYAVWRDLEIVWQAFSHLGK